MESHLSNPDFAERISAILQDLASQGYSVQIGFYPESWTRRAREEISKQSASFRRAGIGKAETHHTSDQIRKDSTFWWEIEKPSEIQKPFVDVLQLLRESINRELFLGLWDFEGHYAIYAPGAFYRKHFDRFQNDSKRTVSLVTFFNTDWKREDGGLLRMEAENGSTLEVLPEAGTLVVFLSDRIPHEVTETRRERLSFAGWYRTR